MKQSFLIHFSETTAPQSFNMLKEGERRYSTTGHRKIQNKEKSHGYNEIPLYDLDHFIALLVG